MSGPNDSLEHAVPGFSTAGIDAAVPSTPLTVLYTTFRETHPLVEASLRHVGQYDLLAQSLVAQSFDDYEVVVVDELNPLPRPELEGLAVPVRYTRPRPTPWRRFGAFDPAGARNSGLAVARGSTILGLDDCVSFGPDLLELVSEQASRGVYLVPNCGAQPVLDGPQTRCGGIVAYPRRLAREVGGHEERFAATTAFEDWEFSERLGLHGVRFQATARARVWLHKHRAGKTGISRCARIVYHLLRHQTRANRPWTAEQVGVFEEPMCPFIDHATSACQLAAGDPCNHYGWPPRPEVLQIMHEYEGCVG